MLPVLPSVPPCVILYARWCADLCVLPLSACGYEEVTVICAWLLGLEGSLWGCQATVPSPHGPSHHVVVAGHTALSETQLSSPGDSSWPSSLCSGCLLEGGHHHLL